MKYKALTTLFMKKTPLSVSVLIVFLLGSTFSAVGNEVQKNPKISTEYSMQITGCGSTVTVVGDNAKPLDGTSVYYLLRIENIGNSVQTFNLSAEDNNQFDENPDGSSPENNVDLNQQLEDLNHNIISGTVTLAPGETYDFYLKLSLLHSTGYDKWNGTKITAVSSSCPDNTGSTLVHTYIPVPDNVIIGYNNLKIPFENITNKVFISQTFIPAFEVYLTASL